MEGGELVPATADAMPNGNIGIALNSSASRTLSTRQPSPELHIDLLYI